MNDLSKLFLPKNVIFNFNADSKEDAISKLLQRLLDNFQITYQNKEFYFEKIMERENSKTTAIGCGIAIPHCTTHDIKKTICVVGISNTGVSCNSNDNCLVHLFFLFLFPASDLSTNLDTLSDLTYTLGDDNLRLNILKSTKFQEFQESLEQKVID